MCVESGIRRHFQNKRMEPQETHLNKQNKDMGKWGRGGLEVQEIEVNLYQKQSSGPNEVLASREEPKERNQRPRRDLKERKKLLSKSRNEGLWTKNQTICVHAPKPETDFFFFCSNWSINGLTSEVSWRPCVLSWTSLKSSALVETVWILELMAVKSCQEARVSAAAVVLEVWARITLIQNKTHSDFSSLSNSTVKTLLSHVIRKCAIIWGFLLLHMLLCTLKLN